MRKTLSGLVALWLAVCGGLSSAGATDEPVRLEDVRLWAAPDRTRVVFDVSDEVEHELFTLTDPHRVVIDIAGGERPDSMGQSFSGKGHVERVRSGMRGDGDLRLVLDLAAKVTPKSFTLPPEGGYGHRLVIDLERSQEKTSTRAERATKPAPRKFVVAVDAGHGGEDPGAIGTRGTKEKEVVMSVARKLAGKIDAEPGMRAVLIRDGDYYVGLRERMRKAREAKADLFVSIHADGFRDRRASGSSVYVLSRNGASSEHARWLAAKENAADLVGGVSLKDKDEDLASFMLDLSQSASIEASLDVAGRVLERLSDVNDLHKHDVQQAGFLVLKSPDIPSLLVETAFISNPHEERELTRNGHQHKIAEAVLDGIKGYFASYRPASRVAEGGARQHTIRRGETLSEIAEDYRVDVGRLRQANSIRSDMIQPGEVITIPSDSG